MKSKFKFGDKVKNKVSKIKGTIVSIVFYDNGTISYNIQPNRLKNRWVDEQHLKIVK